MSAMAGAMKDITHMLHPAGLKSSAQVAVGPNSRVAPRLPQPGKRPLPPSAGHEGPKKTASPEMWQTNDSRLHVE